MKPWIVMPAYNEERSIGAVLDALHKEGWHDIIVVDDGSRDRTAEIAREKGAIVITHPRNMGLGAALRTGLEVAREREAECVVTFDADGQHDPKGVRRMVDALDGRDFVVGVRHFVDIPLHKRVGNFGLNFITRVLGGELTDSQSGMRALNRQALKSIRIQSNRYEVSSELVVQARQKGLRIAEVPVRCVFTKYSRARGTTIASGIRIFLGLLKLRFGGF
ncbi:MAG: glycosyltransferase family 2 protein [Candidatus Hodarchaeaceae archaeon]|nr:glycosyltransferase family 2 protein [Candidatus Hodarchaeaceae archaeon]